MPRTQPLVLCREVKGGATINGGPLVCGGLNDVLLVPLGCNSPAGLYDTEGRLVRSAAYFRGLPHPHFPLEAETTALSVSEVPLAPRDYTYVYGGHYTAHYGHFFFAMLSRLWAIPRPVPSDLRIVLLASGDVEEPFRHEFSATILRALGLSPENFATLNEPIRFETILVPAPGLEENHQGRTAFADFCHDLGARIMGRPPARDRTHPVFLTKRLVQGGVHAILNEDVVCAALERRGVTIVAPERLTLQDQIALWAESPVVSGVFGSALHTSLFADGRPYVALNPERWINSNQVIIDRVNRNTATILYPDDDYLNYGSAGGKGHRLRLKDPQGAARQLWRHIERESDAAWPPSRGAWWPPRALAHRR